MDDDTKKTKRAGSIPRMALTPEELAESTGVGRTTIFEAIRNSELTARKAGNRTTLIECEEARRWLRSLPWRGKPPEIIAAA
jgi:excisionase family DNA binding protein